MIHHAINFPTYKLDLQAIYTFSRLIVLGLRLLDTAIMILFAVAIFYILETVIP
jgi:hypothetical protein